MVLVVQHNLTVSTFNPLVDISTGIKCASEENQQSVYSTSSSVNFKMSYSLRYKLSILTINNLFVIHNIEVDQFRLHI